MYIDKFTYNHLPTADLQSDYQFLDFPQFQRSKQLNCTHRLLDFHIENGNGEAICIQTFDEKWTYKQLQEKSNQIAHYLVDDLDLQSGNRVLLRSANNPMMVACWYAIIKAGGVVVATMPLLRAKELKTVIDCAEISHAICDIDLIEEMELTQSEFLKKTAYFDRDEWNTVVNSKSTTFENYNSNAEDIAIIGFTSGTTGIP